MATWNKYEPTAARARGRPGRETRPKTLTLDIHSHVAIPEAGRIAGPHVEPADVPLGYWSDDATKAVNAKQEGDITEQLFGAGERLADLDRMGLDMQLVMPPPNQCYYTVPLDIAVKAARVTNEGLAEFVGKRPDRYLALGTVPLQDGQAAAVELEHGMTKLGLKGVQILTNVGGKELSDPAYAPFWARAEALGALVVIHPNGFTHGERFKRFYFSNVIGNPLETTIALHYLIFDGVLERHPNLKILAVHGGGYLSAYPGRIDHAWGARSDCNAGLPRPPGEYLRRIYVDSVVFTPAQLRSLVETFGADKVLMGTDYPFDMADYDPVGHVASSGLDETTVAAICGGNAKRLLGIG
jgi:aminocarboxymuconate-semialdehyde decarboxylase